MRSTGHVWSEALRLQQETKQGPRSRGPCRTGEEPDGRRAPGMTCATRKMGGKRDGDAAEEGDSGRQVVSRGL